MIARRCLLRGGAAGGLGFAVLPARLAYAHRETLSHTEIIWNDGSKSLDVTHSFHIHEAETALAAAGMIEKPDLTSLRARARLALYVEASFTLISEDGSPIDLELIGAETARQSVYVYQSVALERAPQSLLIDCQMFRDLTPNFINRIDVRLGEDIRSIEFRGQDGPKKVLA